MAIVRATSYTRSRKAIKATIRYNQHRAGKDGERKFRELFGYDGRIEREDAYRMIDTAEKGTVYFRFVISPDQETEDTAKDLDLHDLTRQPMLALQEHVQQRVPFVAAIHDDHTDNRHVHVVACLTSRLGAEHFKVMRDAATTTATAAAGRRPMGRAGGFLTHLLFNLIVLVNRIKSLFQHSENLHNARFAYLHELRVLLTDKLDEPNLLLGVSRFNELLRVQPTETRRELGNVLVVAPTRGGKGLLATSQLLTWS